MDDSVYRALPIVEFDAEGNIWETKVYPNGKKIRRKVQDVNGEGWANGETHSWDMEDYPSKKAQNVLKHEIVTLGDAVAHLEAVFRLAERPSSMDRRYDDDYWARYTLNDVLHHLYPVFLAIKGLDEPDNGFAEKRFNRRLARLKADYSKELSESKARYRAEFRRVTESAEAEVEAAQTQALQQVAKREAEIEAEIQSRVAAELARLDDLRNGKRRNANGRVVRL